VKTSIFRVGFEPTIPMFPPLTAWLVWLA
jgi:hypothetical protein